MAKAHDEYDWSKYPVEYSAQMKEIREQEGLDFFITKFEDTDGVIDFKDNLHKNWKELYQAAYTAKPSSVFECGAGSGQHLKNLKTLLPTAEIAGCDISQAQIDFGKEFSDLPFSIINNLRVLDFTGPVPLDKKYDFVYTQAVIMHLSTENARKFLRNMAAISNKYIFLIEGVKNHENWYEFVKQTLPEYDFQIIGKHIDNGILLTKKEVIATITTSSAPTLNGASPYLCLVCKKNEIKVLSWPQQQIICDDCSDVLTEMIQERKALKSETLNTENSGETLQVQETPYPFAHDMSLEAFNKSRENKSESDSTPSLFNSGFPLPKEPVASGTAHIVPAEKQTSNVSGESGQSEVLVVETAEGQPHIIPAVTKTSF